MRHFSYWYDDNPPGPEGTVEDVVDMISSAPPNSKKLLLEAIGKAMIRAEIERGRKLRQRDADAAASAAEVERSKQCPNYTPGTRRCNCKDCRALRQSKAVEKPA